MDRAKIHLSKAELELACNAEIILTKNTIIKKATRLLHSVEELILETTDQDSVPSIFSIAPKISKGDNYLGLPYVVLDYPRISQQNDLCFIRSMFWWGNFFSSTLQVSGLYKEKCIQKIKSSYLLFSSLNYFISINDNPWEHHFEETNYKKITLLSKDEFESILQKQVHIKIAAKFPLYQWDCAATTLNDNWKFLSGLITP